MLDSNTTLADFKDFFENAPVALLRKDAKTAKIVMANQRAVDLLGFSSEEELQNSHKTTDFYSKELRDKLIKLLKKHNTIEGYEIEMKLPTKVIWVAMNLSLSKDKHFIDVAMIDITDAVNAKNSQLVKMREISSKLDALLGE